MRWSGNLLATAVILILGLTFGQQVLQWWRGDVAVPAGTDPAAAPQLSQLADPDMPLTLSFGDLPYQLRRHVLVGDLDEALAALRRECRKVAERTDPAAAPALEVAPEVVQQLARREAVEQGVGWRIVQNTGPVITVVALRQDVPDASDTAEPARHNGESVVSWGLGLRAVALEHNSSGDQWTLYVCSGQDRRSAADSWQHIQLPPHAQRTFAVQVDGGGGAGRVPGRRFSRGHPTLLRYVLGQQWLDACHGVDSAGRCPALSIPASRRRYLRCPAVRIPPGRHRNSDDHQARPERGELKT